MVESWNIRKMTNSFRLSYPIKIQCLLQLLFVIVLIGASNLARAQVQAPSNPNSAKSCAICHFRWIDTFFIEGRGSDLVDYTAEKAVATAEMCFSCHDGSIADSRARAYETAQHKINVPPPDHMQIPDIFPLDEKGNLQCATCHTAHGVPSGPNSKETIFMRTSNRNSAMCRMCHPARVDSPKTGNHPLDTSKQEIPADLKAMGALEGDEKNQLICETCHSAHGAPYEGFLIKSGRDSSLCLECHSDKNPQTPNGRKKPLHVVNVAPVNAMIPDALMQKGARVGNNGEIICQSCHKIHTDDTRQAALLVQQQQNSTLCLACHTDKQLIADTKHNLMLSAPEEKNLAGQTVAQTGVCSACHLPHKAARQAAPDRPLSEGLCLNCHSPGNVAEKAGLKGGQHPLAVRPAAMKTANQSTLPLFNDLGFQDQDGKLSCATCHDPHRWRADTAAGPAGKDAPANRQTSFLRKQAPRICRECHADKFPVAGSKHDLSKIAPQAKNVKNQTASESGVCATCHLVHNAGKSFLWARNAAVESPAAAQDLCLECHQRKGLAGKKTIHDPSHPLNLAPAEKGLATTLPLFDKRGKISENGVVSCPTCHNPHRWDPVSTINEDHFKLEGSSQNSFLRMENSPSAKLCEDCHPAQARVDKTEHDLVVGAPSSKNTAGQTARESGTCGVCHFVHNGRSDIVLWAQGFGLGNNIMETMCNSCHSPEGSAKNKVPPVYLHPREKVVKVKTQNQKSLPDYLPLFHGGTGKPVSAGNLSCPSCHNVHQWNPAIPAKGTGVNTEGDASNSFLRPANLFALCRDCHEKDTPYKIKYYHDPARRKFKGIDDMFFQ
jgi:predicted CXXCH cytochrome family protein